MTRLVVIGGDAAGMSAAAEARRQDPGREIVVLERGDDVAYAACGIPYLLGGLVAEVDDLVSYTADELRVRKRLDVRLRAEVVAIDPDARRVRLADGGDLGYDALVVATGARPALPDVPGTGTPGVHALRDLSSARRVDAALAARPGASVLLVGAGPIGLEMSENLCRRGCIVHLVEAAERLVPSLAPEVAAPVADALAAGCASVRHGVRLEGFAPAPGGGVAVGIDGARETHDLVVLGTGVVPNAGIAADAGCRLGPAGAIAVDRGGRTSVDGIWAAGDCATAWHRVTGRDVWMPLATHANRQGRVVGRDVCGRPARFPGVLGSWVSGVFGVAFGATGLDEAQAAEAGFAPEVVARTGRDRSGYIPGVTRVVVRLVFDGPTGRLLGAQSAGGPDTSSRLHALSVALAAGMDVEELAGVDLAYAPPLSALRDPIELAAAAVTGDAP